MVAVKEEHVVNMVAGVAGRTLVGSTTWELRATIGSCGECWTVPYSSRFCVCRELYENRLLRSAVLTYLSWLTEQFVQIPTTKPAIRQRSNVTKTFAVLLSVEFRILQYYQQHIAIHDCHI